VRKTILTIFASALLAGSLVQAAAASEHHHVGKVHHARATTNQSFRDSNAYFRPAPAPFWQAPAVEPDWARNVHDEALSPPAGH
jgi:hypothetical protein